MKLVRLWKWDEYSKVVGYQPSEEELMQFVKMQKVHYARLHRLRELKRNMGKEKQDD